MSFWNYLLGGALTALFAWVCAERRHRRSVREAEKLGHHKLVPKPKIGSAIAVGLLWPLFWVAVIFVGAAMFVTTALDAVFGDD